MRATSKKVELGVNIQQCHLLKKRKSMFFFLAAEFSEADGFSLTRECLVLTFVSLLLSVFF